MNMDFTAWRCCHEKPGENIFCPEEGCPKSYGCARDKGWRTGDKTPPEILGIRPASQRTEEEKR